VYLSCRLKRPDVSRKPILYSQDRLSISADWVYRFQSACVVLFQVSGEADGRSHGQSEGRHGGRAAMGGGPRWGAGRDEIATFINVTTRLCLDVDKRHLLAQG
jgi:hypothetical protein